MSILAQRIRRGDKTVHGGAGRIREILSYWMFVVAVANNLWLEAGGVCILGSIVESFA